MALCIPAVRIQLSHSGVFLPGDQALPDLAARRASHLESAGRGLQQKGVGHPGPTIVYLLALLVRLPLPDWAAQYLVAVVINLVALTA